MTEGEYSITSHEACADCGICCQVFFKGKLKNGTTTLGARDKQWVENEMVPLTADEASALDLMAFTPEQIRNIVAKGNELARCSLLDLDTKRCSDYENRPTGCANYPSYIEVKQHKYCPLFDIIEAERKEATT